MKFKNTYQKKSDIFSTIFLCSIFLLPLIFILFVIFKNKDNKTLTEAPVHLHAPISYQICGEEYKFDEKEQHGLVHGHNDDLVHIEGVIPNDESIKLKRFFNAIGIDFSKDQIGKFKNGDLCPDGKVGKVKFYVNNKENDQFEEYIVKDKDEIKITFN